MTGVGVALAVHTSQSIKHMAHTSYGETITRSYGEIKELVNLIIELNDAAFQANTA